MGGAEERRPRAGRAAGAGTIFMRAARRGAVDRQTIDLGYVMRQFPDLDFGMGDFDHRLRVQKFVYLLQAFDIYLGYDYSWYLRGPYCTQLATVAYTLSRSYDAIPRDQKMAFLNSDVQERFERFKEFIGGRESDNDFLEIAASEHMLRKTTDMSRADIIEKVSTKKKEPFDKALCERGWEDLERWVLI